MPDLTKVEKRMRSLVAYLKEVLTEEETKEVFHFIDHGECGVALEDLKFIYDKKAKPPAKGILDEMSDLAAIMKMDLK